MERLGLGYDDAAAPTTPARLLLDHRLRQRRRARALPGYDLLVQALGGLMSITGEPDGEPQKVGVALVDVLAGLFATVGILAALRHRDATGEGQRVEVDLLSALLAALVNQARGVHRSPASSPARMGNAHPSIAPYELFATGDGELVLAVGNDRQFARAVRRRSARPSSPPTRASPTNAGAGRRTATRCAPRSSGALAAEPAADWVEELTAARRPRRARQRRRRRVRARRAARPRADRRDPARAAAAPPALTRNPIRLSATPATLPQRPAGAARAGSRGTPAP